MPLYYVPTMPLLNTPFLRQKNPKRPVVSQDFASFRGQQVAGRRARFIVLVMKTTRFRHWNPLKRQAFRPFWLPTAGTYCTIFMKKQRSIKTVTESHSGSVCFMHKRTRLYLPLKQHLYLMRQIFLQLRCPTLLRLSMSCMPVICLPVKI